MNHKLIRLSQTAHWPALFIKTNVDFVLLASPFLAKMFTATLQAKPSHASRAETWLLLLTVANISELNAPRRTMVIYSTGLTREMATTTTPLVR